MNYSKIVRENLLAFTHKPRDKKIKAKIVVDFGVRITPERNQYDSTNKRMLINSTTAYTIANTTRSRTKLPLKGPVSDR